MPRYHIAIANRQRTVRIDRRALAALARRVLALERVASAEVSIAVVDDAEIHEVNRSFLNHDFPTDVISFLLGNGAAAGKSEPRAGSSQAKNRRNPQRKSARTSGAAMRRGSGNTIDGEIVISGDTALRNAASHRTSTEHELALYLVHGLLHLCGYDDLTPREKRLMRRREAEALELPRRKPRTSVARGRKRR